MNDHPSISQILWVLIFYPSLIFRLKEIGPFWRWINSDLLYAISLREAYRAWVDEGRPDPMDDYLDLELSRNPDFISAMTHLVVGVDSGDIPLEQWRKE